jgi:hypothetical protein
LELLGILATIATSIANTNGQFAGHPYLAYWFYAASILMIVVAIGGAIADRLHRQDAKAASTQEKKQYPEETDQRPSIHHTEQRVEANPQQHIHIGSDLFANVRSTPTAATIQPHSEPKFSDAQIEFKGVKLTRISQPRPDLSDLHEEFVEDSKGNIQAVLARFRNDASERINSGVQEPGVRAHIIYLDANRNELTDVPADLWLQEHWRYTTFTSGETKSLVLFIQSASGVAKMWKEEKWTAWGQQTVTRSEELPNNIAAVEVRLLSESGVHASDVSFLTWRGTRRPNHRMSRFGGINVFGLQLWQPVFLIHKTRIMTFALLFPTLDRLRLEAGKVLVESDDLS